MPMAAERNQERQHHQVENPTRPLNTAGVKTCLSDCQARENWPVTTSTASSISSILGLGTISRVGTGGGGGGEGVTTVGGRTHDPPPPIVLYMNVMNRMRIIGQTY